MLYIAERQDMLISEINYLFICILAIVAVFFHVDIRSIKALALRPPLQAYQFQATLLHSTSTKLPNPVET